MVTPVWFATTNATLPLAQSEHEVAISSLRAVVAISKNEMDAVKVKPRRANAVAM
jgi:hypothetical protein